MNSKHILTTLVLLASFTYTQAKNFDKEYVSGIQERLKNHVHIFQEDKQKIQKEFDLGENEYFISAYSLVKEKKDTLYFLNPIDDEKLNTIKEKNPKKKIYSIKQKDKDSLSIDAAANFVNDRVIGVDEKEEVRTINVLNEILSIYPNPTNSSSKIIINLPFNVNSLEGAIYNILGQEIIRYDFKDSKTKGQYELNCNFKSNISSGTYVFNLRGETNDKYFTATTKIQLVK